MPTNYALFLNGKRGAGKTYCVKSQISDLIKNTDTSHDASEKYKFLYISLFGIDSLDEIYTMMVMELYPILKNKSAKIGLGLTKIVARGLLGTMKLGSINDFLGDFGSISKDAIDTKNFVFIFDDIDRKSSKLDIGNLIGFINSLVEHENNKVILIAESELINDKDYSQVREKTIGTHIEYAPDLTESYDALASAFIKNGSQHYEKFLQRFKSEIISCFIARGSTNLRILSYLFQHLYIVFGEIYDQVGLDKQQTEESENMQKVRSVVKFAAGVCLEFRVGKISFSERGKLDDKESLQEFFNRINMEEMFRSNGEKTKIESTKSFLEEFLGYYFPKNDYIYYESLYGFLTGGSPFDMTMLTREWKKHFDDRRRTELPQFVLYQNLHITRCLDLSNSELKKKSKELISYALKGAFPLDHYLSVFYYIDRFNDILGYNMQHLAKRIILALEKHKKSFAMVHSLSRQFGIEKERKYYNEYLMIFKKALKINEAIDEKQKSADQGELFAAFSRNPQEFYETAYKQYGTPIFPSWSGVKAFAQIKKMTPTQILGLANFLGHISAQLTTMEIKFLKELMTLLITIKSRLNLKGYVLDILRVNIDQAIEKHPVSN